MFDNSWSFKGLVVVVAVVIWRGGPFGTPLVTKFKTKEYVRIYCIDLQLYAAIMKNNVLLIRVYLKIFIYFERVLYTSIITIIQKLHRLEISQCRSNDRSNKLTLMDYKNEAIKLKQKIKFNWLHIFTLQLRYYNSIVWLSFNCLN